MIDRLDNIIDEYISDFIFSTWSPEPIIKKTNDKICYVFVIPTDRFNSVFNMFSISFDECRSHFNKWFIKNNPEYENVRAITFMDYGFDKGKVRCR